MWFFTADWHLGHSNIIKYCKRPFLSREEEGLMQLVDRGVIPPKEFKISSESTERMTNAIIDNTNAVVGPDDSLVIIGDFCAAPKHDRSGVADKFRKSINCKNVYLIYGNHDDRNVLKEIFPFAEDCYSFNVNGQNIFCSHYPCRSWNKAHHGSWCLYGHVHGKYGPEDNGDLMPYEKSVFTDGFYAILDKYGIDEKDEIVKELLSVCSSSKGIDLTLDVGVDNQIRGDKIPFGTPWSMDELSEYMGQKRSKWEARKALYLNFSPLSSLKS